MRYIIVYACVTFWLCPLVVFSGTQWRTRAQGWSLTEHLEHSGTPCDYWSLETTGCLCWSSSSCDCLCAGICTLRTPPHHLPPCKFWRLSGNQNCLLHGTMHILALLWRRRVWGLESRMIEFPWNGSLWYQCVWGQRMSRLQDGDSWPCQRSMVWWHWPHTVIWLSPEVPRV